MSTAIITGGAVRLGGAMALHLGKKGIHIALLYNSSVNKAEKCMEEIRKYGVRCIGYQHDLNKIEGLPALMDRLINDFSDMSLLINSASIFPAGTLEDTSIEQLDKTFRINLLAPFVLMREYRRKVGRGQIINILDQRISGNRPSHAAYSVTKTALSHLTTLAAVEFGSMIRVNGIAPGLILPKAGKDKRYFEKQGNSIPVTRTGSIEDMLKGIDYLIDNTFVNGDILYIDGGESKGKAFNG